MAVNLKLHIVVDKKKNRVLFAEARKDFVDFIFHILALPLGAVARILSDDTFSLGSLGSLREGIKKLDANFTGFIGKDYLLEVKAPYRGTQISQLLAGATFSQTLTFYQCNRGSVYDRPCFLNHTGRERCCSMLYNFEGSLIDVVGSDEGYVDNMMVMFMVMDDLTVRSSVATAGFLLLDEFSIKDVGAIEKREVIFGTNEAVKLLKASLSSKTVLTDVFLTGGAAAKS